TDSTRVSADAITDVRNYISKLGPKYLPSTPNEYAGKKQADAQDAHEAIRPTNVDFTPDSIRRHLSDEQYRLYKLIWQRFVASQMTPAVFDQTTVDILAEGRQAYDFRASGSVLKFDGHLRFEEEEKQARAQAKAAEQASAVAESENGTDGEDDTE